MDHVGIRSTFQSILVACRSQIASVRHRAVYVPRRTKRNDGPEAPPSVRLYSLSGTTWRTCAPCEKAQCIHQGPAHSSRCQLEISSKGIAAHTTDSRRRPRPDPSITKFRMKPRAAPHVLGNTDSERMDI